MKNIIARLSFNANEWLLFAAVLAVTHFLSYTFQEHTTVHQGLGWDGRIYHHMAYQFLNDEIIAQRSPFVYRQLTPWLAAAISDSPRDLLGSFRALNLVFATLTSILILLILKPLAQDWRVRLLVASLYPLHYFISLRASYWDGNHVTGFAALSFAAAVYLMQKIQQQWRGEWLALLCVLAFFAVLNRSSALIIMLAAPLCLPLAAKSESLADKVKALLDKKTFPRRLLLLLPLAAGLAAYFLVRQNIQVTGYYGEEQGGDASTSFYYVNKLYSIKIFWMLQSLFIAYGPMLALLLWKWRLVASFLWNNWHILFLTLVIFLYAALSEFTRQFLVGMPLYLMFLALVLHSSFALLSRQRLLLGILLLGQLISQRVFWTLPHNIPDEPSLVPPDAPATVPGLFTPFSSDFLFYDLVPTLVEKLGREYNFYGPIICLQYILFITAILFTLSLIEEKKK